MKGRLVLFVLGLTVWLLLSWSVDIEHVIVGMAVATFVTLVTGDFFAHTFSHFKQITRYLWFCHYMPIFLWECFKANIDVALRVLNPRLPINPGIVKVKTTLRSDTALTFLANSITLTPGTLCVDIDQQREFLYIHWIDVRAQDTERATQLIVNKFEMVLKRIFE